MTPVTISWFSFSLPGTDQIRKPVVIPFCGSRRAMEMVAVLPKGTGEVMVMVLPETLTPTPPASMP